MGWNSYDSYGGFVNESQVRAAADYMAANLKQFGWNKIVVDYCWSWTGAQQGAIGSGTTGSGYLNQNFSGGTATPQLQMDGFGRLMPAVNRFPSAANGAGFGPLADYVHSLGLEFGIHIMRGIPRQAYQQNTPVFGSAFTASQAALTSSTCPWLNQMYGLQTSGSGTLGTLTAAAQAYENSLLNLYASWGVDFIKEDDMLSTTYHAQEINGIRTAIDQSGRPMVLSLSPGPAPIAQNAQLVAKANMWRITNDMWDNWGDLSQIFTLANNWQPYSDPGHWADADMLPLGHFVNPPVGVARDTALTHDQQRTMISLWSIVRSPLMFGGDLPSLASDPWTRSLITNANVISVNQNSTNNHQLFNSNNKVAWSADVPSTTSDKYAALFNTGTSPTTVTLNFGSLGLSPTGTYSVVDLWKGMELGNRSGSFTANLAAYASGMYRINAALPVNPTPQWYNDTSGNWNDALNWTTNVVPNGPTAQADFLSAISAARTIYADVPVTVGTLNFDNASSYVVTGAGSITLQDSTSGPARVIVHAGAQKLSLPIKVNGNAVFDVSAGATLTIANPMTIQSSTTLSQTGSGTVVYQSTVDVEPGARMNMAGGSFVVDDGASQVTTLKTALRSGYNGGTWDGPGISSSAAASDPMHSSVGYAVDESGHAIVRLTYGGDADLNGVANFDDLLTTAEHFDTPDNDWADGNFDYDVAGVVDFADLLILARNYRPILTPAERTLFSDDFLQQWDLAVIDPSVPEPAAAAAVGIVATLVATRRRRAELLS